MQMVQDKRFASAWYSKPGVIYFVGAGHPPVAVKIGVTQRDKLSQRIRAIQSCNHEKISLLGSIVFADGDKPLLQAERQEQLLHRKFAEHQRMADGAAGHEWFEPAPAILEFIASIPLIID
jgi:hypothetical protein